LTFNHVTVQSVRQPSGIETARGIVNFQRKRTINICRTTCPMEKKKFGVGAYGRRKDGEGQELGRCGVFQKKGLHDERRAGAKKSKKKGQIAHNTGTTGPLLLIKGAAASTLPSIIRVMDGRKHSPFWGGMMEVGQ